MSLALQVRLTARTIAIRPVDRIILSSSINERIVLNRQKRHDGAASYDHSLLSYAKHVLQKSLAPERAFPRWRNGLKGGLKVTT